jgi:hypothetical protein
MVSLLLQMKDRRPSGKHPPVHGKGQRLPLWKRISRNWRLQRWNGVLHRLRPRRLGSPIGPGQPCQYCYKQQKNERMLRRLKARAESRGTLQKIQTSQWFAARSIKMVGT